MNTLYPLIRSAALGVALLAVPASAQVHTVDVAPSSAPLPAATSASRTAVDLSKTGPMSHVDPLLQEAYAEAQAPIALRSARRAATSYVTVDAISETADDADALEASLVSLGFKLSGRMGTVISGYLPVMEIGSAAELANLQALMAPQYLLHRADGDVAAPFLLSAGQVGAVEGEASRALRADVARTQFGVDGSGICIGVLSDSYSVAAGPGVAASIASGDVPEDVLVILQPAAGSDEGRAMVELAYDVAPGADFAFHTAFGGTATFANGILRLYNAGCRVIVDDVSNSVEPMFQDGLIAQAVDVVVGAGASYFSSAGNSANASYEGDYEGTDLQLAIGSLDEDDEPTVLLGGELHDFDPGAGVDAFQDVTLFPGERLRFVFGYDEPSAIAEGFPGVTRGQAPTSDYDVFVLDVASPAVVDSVNILAASARNNPGIGIPYEFIEYTNTTGAAQTVYVAITKFSGEDRRLKYINFGGTRQVIEEAEYAGASTTFGHSNARGAFATGAAPWFNTAEFNGFVNANRGAFGPAVVESFTSYGGLEIRLDVNGNRIDPDDRMKPDAVASDADNNTFFGFDTSIDADTNPNFFGTSAAAPNLAAVAALMVEAAGGAGEISPLTVYAAIENTAEDLLIEPGANPRFNFGAGPGYDRQTGNGFVIGDEAVAAVAAPACSAESALAFGDFDADGDDPTFGEFVVVENLDGPVRLMGCTFAVFDPLTEQVTYAASASGSLGTEDAFVLATMDGDGDLPEETIPDGPGAFVLVVGEVAVGDDVATVLMNTEIVAAVVYQNEDDVFASVGGTGSAAENRQALLAALSQLANPVADEGETPAVDLSVVAAPNPVSGRGSVSFGVADAGDVRVTLYDALGRQVALLAEQSYTPGRHTVRFPASELPAGVYVVRVSAESETRTVQLTVVR